MMFVTTNDDITILLKNGDYDYSVCNSGFVAY